ncbi:ribosomal protein S18-alanine N-acetyltransferase [Terrabacter terrigena]|uniref:Ribosomal protein S18-alanine N-acetyltransferase n=1 Tax=Terrabacter terrigena TaxID=574718 RepID=A0ABW3MXJ0_9MICO
MTTDPTAPSSDRSSDSGGNAPPPGLSLRDLEWTDLARLAELEQDLFADDAWSEATWWSELAGRARRDYVVAVAPDGSIAGYAGLDVSGDVADVMTVATAPGGQGRGTGRLLLDELVRRAVARGVEAVLLEVRADNAAARRLYDGAGFEVISVRRRYYQPGDVDALVMRLLVPKGDA